MINRTCVSESEQSLTKSSFFFKLMHKMINICCITCAMELFNFCSRIKRIQKNYSRQSRDIAHFLSDPKQEYRKPNVAITYFGIGTNDFDTNRKLFTIALTQKMKKLGQFRCS